MGQVLQVMAAGSDAVLSLICLHLALTAQPIGQRARGIAAVFLAGQEDQRTGLLVLYKELFTSVRHLMLLLVRFSLIGHLMLILIPCGA